MYICMSLAVISIADYKTICIYYILYVYSCYRSMISSFIPAQYSFSSCMWTHKEARIRKNRLPPGDVN